MTDPRPSSARLVLAHARAQSLEILRSPLSLVTNTMYPTLAFVFFVLPQRGIVTDPTQSLVATAQLAIFGVLTSLVFGYGIAAAQDRADPWTTYVRTLPAGAIATTAARFLVAFTAVTVGLVPLLTVAVLATAAPTPFLDGNLPMWRAGAAALVVLASGVPFLAMAVAIGYSTTPRSALALAQLVTFPLAFVGGLMFPPDTFPAWADVISLATPARAARDLAVGVLLEAPIPLSSIPVFAGWSIALTALAIRANRRDEGRRYR
ncbi:MAG: ABC transporter permease [Mobilicoccus sp.]|nr:ABC transporter permease [Mobilicoccus sp.]